MNVENAEDDELIGQVINEISYVKNELMDKADFQSEVLTKDEFVNTYNMYENYKEEIKKIDFDDMLIRTYYLLQNNQEVLRIVQSVYKYILVDEFQDVNKVQFEVLKLYTNCTAAVLRAKECVLKTAATIQENAEDVYAEAQQINEDRAAKEEQEYAEAVAAEEAKEAEEAAEADETDFAEETAE